MKIGFDNNIYVEKQTQKIKERIRKFGNKLYLEFGGKLFDDYHAARVLPGFDVNGKIRLLLEFKDMAEIVFCINANDIEKHKIRADMGITYDMDLMRLIDQMRKLGLMVNGVVVTQYTGQQAADVFMNKLESRNVRTYRHYVIPGYPANADFVVSDEGLGKNDYIETTRPLVVVTAPGPCSGKLATCLSQLYHENKRGIKAGYAKFETFPVWNLPLRHPVNLAYEAATADLKDVNMIDPFHLEAYGKLAVNYNRDVEVFPVVKAILEKIVPDADVYQSPTDMGVNMAGYGIFNDEIVRNAAEQEIIRRYYTIKCDCKQGLTDSDTLDKVTYIMKQLNLTPDMRTVVAPALKKSEEKKVPVIAIELEDGKIVTGKTTDIMTAGASALLNALKKLSDISDELLLISPVVLEPIVKLKKNALHLQNTILNAEEVLMALSICAVTNPMAETALSAIEKLKNTEAHSSVIVHLDDAKVYKRLGINLTCEAEFISDDLFPG
ncbi:MAG: DUF1846 domain-containing protein [Clostridia bacterium]|nr:DUF1846 domain-containing protein [Clostridia bacterium]